MTPARLVLTLLALPLLFVLSRAAVQPEPRPRAATSVPTLCAAPGREGRLRAWRCEASEPLFYSSNSVRVALGEPLCWWHVSRDELDELPRMSDATAKAVFELRATGAALTVENLHGVRGIGASTADDLYAALTEECAYVALQQASPTPPQPSR